MKPEDQTQKKKTMEADEQVLGDDFRLSTSMIGGRVTVVGFLEVHIYIYIYIYLFICGRFRATDPRGFPFNQPRPYTMRCRIHSVERNGPHVLGTAVIFPGPCGGTNIFDPCRLAFS